MNISRSGLLPDQTPCHVMSAEPTHGVTSITSAAKSAHGPTSVTNRVAVSPRSGGRDDVLAVSPRPVEDSGCDFKDFIQSFGCQDLFGSSVGRDRAITQGDHPPGVLRRKVDVVGDGDDRQILLTIQALQNLVEMDLVLQIQETPSARRAGALPESGKARWPGRPAAFRRRSAR